MGEAPEALSLATEGTPEVIGGRFRVHSQIGDSSRRQVLLASDERDGRDLAVTLFTAELMGEGALARSRREIAAMERLGEHPHVVSVLETGEHDGRPFVVSLHMPGGDMRTRLAAAPGGRLDPREAVAVAVQICRALEHAHGCGIVHRDLKPANVWLDDAGNARLGGFGLSSTGPARGGGVLVGTVAYLPPEQALGQTSGPRADIYSLGAMLYEMLCGHPPFLGDDAVSIIGQHLNAEAVPPSRQNPAVPPGLDDLVARMLAKRRADRPASAAALREELEAINFDEERDAAPAAARPLDALAGGVFVGRDPELTELRRATDAALDGQGRLLMLSGEPGIGKTRTVEELSTYARVGGAKVHWGRCHEEDGAPAFWPWVQAIRSYVREADPVALAWEMGAAKPEIARLVPEVAGVEAAGEAAGPAPDDEQARFRLFDAVETFLGAAATSRPLMVVLDDLHWADESSLRLLEFCVRGLSDAPLLLVGTYRDVELGRHHPLSRVLGELTRSSRTTSVVLRGLREPDVRRYMEMTTGDDVDPQLSASVQAQTEGNPFFVGEVVRLLAQEGEGGTDTAERTIPQGVRDVVGRRLDALSGTANRALGVAAAIGREFDHPVLAEILAGEPGLDEALDEAAGARLVEPAGGDGLRFSHALVRETLYRELDPARRPQLHRDIARTLETRYAPDGERFERNLGVIAHHYLEAGAAADLEKTVDYATRAGHRAFEQRGYDEAAKQFGRALTALEGTGGDDASLLDLMLSRGEAQLRAGSSLGAFETLGAAAKMAEDAGGPERMLRATRLLAMSQEAGYSNPVVISLAEKALAEIEPGDSRERVELLVWLAAQHVWTDPQGLSVSLYRDAIDMARRMEDDWALAFALSRFIIVDTTPMRERMTMGDELFDAARAAGDRELEMRGHVLKLVSALAVGDIASVDQDLGAYSRLAAELREPQHLWHVPMLQAMRKTIDGDLAEAERLSEQARIGGERAQEPIAAQFHAIQAAYRLRLQGRMSEIGAQVSAMVERYPAIPAWRVAYASILIESGRLEEARLEFDRLCANDLALVARDAQWVGALTMLAEIAFVLSDGERARRIHELLEPYTGEIIVIGRAAISWGPADRGLGLASAAAGDLERALAEFESALEQTESMGDRPFGAAVRLDIATVLLRRNARGDRERALGLLDECLTAAQEIGMRPISERALALKLETQGIAGIDVTTSIGDVIEAVETERPDVRGFAAPDGTVTILFSDIESSTAMTERLGDERWLDVLRNHNMVFRERLLERGGYEVKNQGDGFMLVFPDPAEALRCAIDVQHDLADRAAERPEEGVRVRMGLHTGEAIAEEGDFFGRNVILAARIAAEADGGEVLVSDALRERIDGKLDVGFDDGRNLELKGLAGSHRVYGALKAAPR